MVINKQKVLTEATLDNVEEVDVNGNKPTQVQEAELFESLDRAYVVGMRKLRKYLKTGDRQSSFPAILVTGHAGVGKTALVKRWGAEHNPPVQIVEKQAQHMEAVDLGGAVAPDKATGRVAVRLRSTDFDMFKEKKDITDVEFPGKSDELVPKVLFLDELNRAPGPIRGALLTTINDHTISDSTKPQGSAYLPELLFVVAAINPYGKGYEGVEKMDPAELARFEMLGLVANPIDSLNYFLKRKFPSELKDAREDGDTEYEAEILRKQNLVKTLLTDPDFVFAGDDEYRMSNKQQIGILNPRSLEKTLDECDGTKENFLKLFPRYCGMHAYQMVKDILAQYVDKDDKANAALKMRGGKKQEPTEDSLDKFTDWKKKNGF